MHLLKQWFTAEGKIYRQEKKLQHLLAQASFPEADRQFCRLFESVVARGDWNKLAMICRSYIPTLKDHTLVRGGIREPSRERALDELEKKGDFRSAILLGDLCADQRRVVALYAKAANSNDLFSYLLERNILSAPLLDFALQSWETHNGPISTNPSLIAILKGIATENPDVIPARGTIKECIGQFEEAALLYRAESKIPEAASCFARAGKLEQALAMYRQAGDAENISVIAEKMGDYALALEHVVKPERKFELLLRTNELEAAKSFAYGFSAPEPYLYRVKARAAELVDQKIAEHNYLEALSYHMVFAESPAEKQKILEHGRKHYVSKQLESNEPDQAETYLRKRIELEARSNHYELAAQLAEEELEDAALAIDYYEKAHLFNKAIELTATSLPAGERTAIDTRLADLHRRGGNLLKAARLYESLDRFADAYDLYYQLNHYEKAIECYRKLPEREEEQLIELYKQVGDYQSIFNLLLGKNDYRALRQALELAKQVEDRAMETVIETKLRSLGSYSRTDFDAKYTQAKRKVWKRYTPVIGIDFGTTTSVCALYDKESGRAEIVKDAQGNPFTDSYFAIHQGAYLFGRKAKLLGQTHPECVVSKIKRHLGKNQTFTIAGKSLSAEEITAHQLANLTANANRFVKAKIREVFAELLGESVPAEIIDDYLHQQEVDFVREAVLTVPAYFNDSQKKSTRDAAEIAGLKIRRLLHEPTAAALAFKHKKRFAGKIAVLDLGGGTFDISVLDIDDKVCEVKQIGGNAKLGGADIDRSVYEYFQNQIEKEFRIRLADPPYRVAAARLQDACEQIKIHLSFQSEYRAELLHFLNTPRYSIQLSRPELEKIADPFFTAYRQAIQSTLENGSQPVDHFILVGNATKMPKIVEVSQHLFKTRPMKGIDPGLVVAQGAAIDAAILTEDISDQLILDVVPFGLGIMVGKEKKEISRIIEKDTTIPVAKTKKYTTVEDNQTVVRIPVYQGESTVPDQNHYLGEFNLTGLLPAKAGQPEIDVTFSIDADCILEVTAKDRGTGQANSIRISGSTRLSYTEKKELKNRFAQQKVIGSRTKRMEELNREIERGLHQFTAQQNQVDQLRQQLFRLTEERLQNNPDHYRATPDQIEVISELFREKDDLLSKNQRLIDRFISLRANIEQIRGIHLDYTAKDIEQILDERLRQLEFSLDGVRQLNQAYTSEIVRRLSKWVDTLDQIEPDLEKMTVLQKANYWVSKGNIAGATTLLEQHLVAHSADRTYLDSLLQCYRQSGNRNNYQTTIRRHQVVLGITLPDFDQLNSFLREVGSKVFLIVVTTEEGQLACGSGFCIAPHFVATNRHVVEKAQSIRLIGKHGVVKHVAVEMDDQNDIALIQTTTTLEPMRLGVTEFIEPGEKTIAIGFPNPESDSFADNLFISQGIVNSIRKHAICTDRVIYMGNKIGRGMSGGPLLNGLGEVIGMTTLYTYRPELIKNKEQEYILATDMQPIAIPIHLATRLLREKSPYWEASS